MLTILSVIAYLFLQMCIVWLIYRALNNPAVVDVSWAIGLTVCGLIYLFPWHQSSIALLTVMILLAWGLRLAGYLWYTRIRIGLVDKRYLTLSENWKIAKSLGFFLNFQLQAIFIVILSLPFYFIGRSLSAFSGGTLLFLGISLMGIIGESIADRQLQNFKKQSPGQVCNVGLWRYSRHPNYFFEWLVWLGFAGVAVWQGGASWLALLSPLLLYLLMTRITAPLTEQGSLQSKGARYQAYQAKTALFFLWPPKK
jgi:steroid 5-alpha reductase family enzyme